MRSMTEKTAHTDILIVGAGLVGLSAAIALTQAGFSVRLLERQPPEKSTRPISLSYGSYRFLQKLNIWQALENSASPILSVHVSEQGKFGFTKFSAQEENVPALGFVVPYADLLNALLKHADTITYIDDIQNIFNDEKGVELTTTSARFSADLLIAADGTYSTCRDFLKIPFDEKNSGDVAEIFQLELSEPHHHIAYERFTQNGTLAVLPLFDNKKAQLVWTHKPRECEKCKPKQYVQQVFEGRLMIDDIKKIASFPLKTVIAHTQIAPSAVILGNAAHTIYPVAAQGFNLGLHDLNILKNILCEMKNRNQPIFGAQHLKNYENKASKHQQKIFNLTNQLTILFDLPGIGCARGFGLLSTDLITPIKSRLAKRAMGITS